MEPDYLCSLLKELVSLPCETEWVEFKLNTVEPENIGQYLSAISNSAALQEKQFGYIIWGVEDNTHNILGTSFKPKLAKVGSQDLENWLSVNLEPRINFKIHEFQCDGNNIVLFEIPRANYVPIQFKSIKYDGKNRIKTLREMQGQRGYAAGFKGLIGYISNLLPQNEVINSALRTETTMYPEIAIRELVANAIIHQNFDITGTGPVVEIFSDRIEITNPGTPLIDPIRFLDQPPRSRNEALASFMRRINICEERGSGIDKVIDVAEYFQLPAPSFKVSDNHTQAILFAYKKLASMNKDDKIRACYQHACLKLVSNEQMTNSSLRQRFSISSTNASIASRIISDTIDAGFIKPYDPSNDSKKHAKYVPFFWD